MSTDIIRILLIEDNPGDARLIKEMLKDSLSVHYELKHLVDIAELLNLDVKGYDVVIMDLNYDSMSGLKSYKYASRYLSTLPIIVLTGLNDDELGYEIVKRGAQDYLIKGESDAKTLVRSIRYSIERKKAQSNLKIAQGKNRALQNTANLLRQEGDRLRELNKAKDEFISLASHQLRTPATIVKQYLAMVLGNYAGELQELQKSFIQKAYESNERQLHIVDDILSIARLDGSDKILNMTDQDARQIVQEAVNSISSQVASRHQELTLTMPEHRVDIKADPRQLQMVVENILENASHYSAEYTRIEVRLEEVRSKIEIAIADQGVGIAPEEVSKLFKKFSRIPNKYSVQAGGTGLGLYWASKVTKLHKGQIRVSSQLGEGTTFRILLPATFQQDPDEATQQPFSIPMPS